MIQEYISLLAAAISFGTTALLGKKVIPWLHKLKYGQTIKDIGPKWHEKKQGTPTMGGIMFIAGILAAFLVCLPIYHHLQSTGRIASYYENQAYWLRMVAGILMSLLFGAIGVISSTYSVIPVLQNLPIPGVFYSMLPYIITLIVVAVTPNAHNAPAVCGEPYDKSKR